MRICLIAALAVIVAGGPLVGSAQEPEQQALAVFDVPDPTVVGGLLSPDVCILWLGGRSAPDAPAERLFAFYRRAVEGAASPRSRLRRVGCRDGATLRFTHVFSVRRGLAWATRDVGGQLRGTPITIPATLLDRLDHARRVDLFWLASRGLYRDQEFVECPAAGCAPQHERIIDSVFPTLRQSARLLVEGVSGQDALRAAVRSLANYGQEQQIPLPADSTLGRHCRGAVGTLSFDGAAQWWFRCDIAGEQIQIQLSEQLAIVRVHAPCTLSSAHPSVPLGRAGDYFDYVVTRALPDAVSINGPGCTSGTREYSYVETVPLTAVISGSPRTSEQCRASPIDVDAAASLRLTSMFTRNGPGPYVLSSVQADIVVGSSLAYGPEAFLIRFNVGSPARARCLARGAVVVCTGIVADLDWRTVFEVDAPFAYCPEL